MRSVTLPEPPNPEVFLANNFDVGVSKWPKKLLPLIVEEKQRQ